MSGQVFTKKEHQDLKCQICSNKSITKSIFRFHLYSIVQVDILFYSLGQTYTSLTCTKIDTPYILECREYTLETNTKKFVSLYNLQIPLILKDI